VTSPKPPRHFLVISRPTTHNEAPPRKELVRGQYESVELIREVPLHQSPESEDAEQNPVEWIMVTRSEPGGGIPKFMVERGTPGAIVADVPKFFDWACGRDYSKDMDPDAEEEHSEHHQDTAATGGVETSQPEGVVESHDKSLAAPVAIQSAESNAHAALPQVPQESEGGIISTLTNAVTGYIPYLNHQTPHLNTANEDDDSSSIISTATASSAASFASAKEINSKDPKSNPQSPTHDPHISAPSTSTSALSSTSPAATEDPETSSTSSAARPKSQHERELLKLTQKRLSLDRKISKAQLDETKKAAEISTKDEKERAKAVEKHERDRKKQEEKFKREAEKLEQKREKEEQKVEERRRKAREKDVLGRVGWDRDEWRERCGVAEREVEVLRKRVEVLEGECGVGDEVGGGRGGGGIGASGEDGGWEGEDGECGE